MRFWGEWLVIAGIVVEIIAAGTAAKDEWQTRQAVNALKAKPLHERIQGFLNELDPTILISLKANPAGLWVDMPMSQRRIDELWRLYSENGAHDFLGINPPVSLEATIGYEGTVLKGLKFVVFTNVFDGSKWSGPR